MLWGYKMAVWTMIGFFIFFFIYSIWLRTNRYRQNVQVEPRISPVSLAMQELIAIAGGIYLSLIMVVSFLKISIPEKINIYTVDLDPLAFLAICLGIVQPIIMNLIKKVK